MPNGTAQNEMSRTVSASPPRATHRLDVIQTAMTMPAMIASA